MMLDKFTTAYIKAALWSSMGDVPVGISFEIARRRRAVMCRRQYDSGCRSLTTWDRQRGINRD